MMLGNRLAERLSQFNIPGQLDLVTKMLMWFIWML